MSFTEASTNMDSYQTNPKGIDAAYEFGLGTHKVEYIARNKYGDVAKCSYNVEVVGKRPFIVSERSPFSVNPNPNDATSTYLDESSLISRGLGPVLMIFLP